MRILISGTCPASLNSNYGLLKEIARGFDELSLVGASIEFQLVPLENLPLVIQHWRPTFTLLVGGLALCTIPLSMVRFLCHQVNSRLVFWSLEDPYEFDCVMRHGHLFDLLITSDAASRCFYPGDWKVKHLPLASRDRPLRDSANVLKHTASWFFCGVPFKTRLLWINSLVNACPEGLVIGPDWPDFSTPTRVCRDRIGSETLSQLYSCLPLTIYIGRDFNIANSPGVVPSTPGPRLFECAGSTGRQLFLGPGLELENYYEPDKEILVADTIEEVLDRLTWATSNPKAMADMAECAWRRTQAEHLYFHRAKQMLIWFQEL